MRLAPILLLAGLTSCSVFLTGPDYPPPPPPEVLDREFTPEELRADLDELFAILEEVHPDPYTVLPREEVARRRAELAAGLDRPLKRIEFEVMPFQLQHTRLSGQVSSALFVRANGDATSRGGIEPDVLVRAAPDAKGDPVLEAAIARLLAPAAGP